MSQRNVKLVLKILNDLELSRGSSNKKETVVFNSFVCKLGSLWHEWASLKCAFLAGPLMP
jgi:hypothetical protein